MLFIFNNKPIINLCAACFHNHEVIDGFTYFSMAVDQVIIY